MSDVRCIAFISTYYNNARKSILTDNIMDALSEAIECFSDNASVDTMKYSYNETRCVAKYLIHLGYNVTIDDENNLMKVKLFPPQDSSHMNEVMN